MNRRGSILLATLSMMLVLIALTGYYLFAVKSYQNNAGWDDSRSRIFWLGEAGLHKGIWNLQHSVAQGGWGNQWNGVRTEGPAVLGVGFYLVQATRIGGNNGNAQFQVISLGFRTIDTIVYSRTVQQNFQRVNNNSVTPLPNTWSET